MNRRVLGAVALAVGAVLAVCGSLLALYRAEMTYTPGHVDRQVITAWQMSYDLAVGSGAETSSAPGWGFAITAAAALAVVAVVLLFRSPLLGALGRFAAVLATGVLIGTTWSVYATLRRLFVIPDPPVGVVQGLGVGMWVLAVACPVVALGAALVQDWPARLPKPEGPSVHRVDDDEATPPFGIAIPTGEPGLNDGRHPTGGNPSTVER